MQNSTVTVFVNSDLIGVTPAGKSRVEFRWEIVKSWKRCGGVTGIFTH